MQVDHVPAHRPVTTSSPVRPARRRRPVGRGRAAVLGAAIAAALVAEVCNGVPASAAPVSVSPSTTTLIRPADYYVTEWNDALDYNNPEDISLTRLQINEGDASLTGGRLRVERAAQIILSRGDPGAVPTSAVRDPRARVLDGNVYTRVSFRMHSDRTTVGAVGYRTCDGCADGYRYFDIVPGWHTYDLDMVGDDDLEPPPAGAPRRLGPAWGGSVGLLYLAIAFNTPTKPTVMLDDASVYAPTAPVTLTLGSGTGNVELWSDTNENSFDDGTFGGGVGETANRLGSFNVGTTVRAWPGVFRSDQPVRFYTVQHGVKSAVSPVVNMPSSTSPMPVVMSPSELGGTDFATEVRGDPWEFDQPSDVNKTFNVDASVHDGALFANAAGNRNDPVVLFNLGAKSIDATRYHKVAVTMNFDGPWGLEDAPGGGLVGRFVWQGAGGAHEQVSMPIVVKPGRATYVMSFRTSPPTAILDPTGNVDWIGWGTGATTFVNMFRFDPHEDPGSRTWQIDDVKLLRDEEVAPTFAINFRDDRWGPGTTAELYADTNRLQSDGRGALIGTMGVGPGINTYTWNGAGVGAGSYYVHVVLQRGGRILSASSTGQVSVGLGGAGEPPAAQPAAPPGPTQAQLIAFFTWVLHTKFFCGVARSRNIAWIGAAPICNQLLGTWVRPKARRRR